MWRKRLLACGVLSSVLYVGAELVAARRYPGYSDRSQVVSELLGSSAPTRPFMVATAGPPYNLLMAPFAAGASATAGGKRAGSVTGSLLAGYATASAAGAFLFFMDQRDVLAAGEGTRRKVMHGPSTLVLSHFLLGAMGSGAKLLGKRFRTYRYGTMVILVAFGGLTGMHISRFGTGEPTPWAGITERINIYATMLWIAALAVGLLRRDLPETCRVAE